MDKKLMEKYAEFIVKVGVNVGPGQTLIIRRGGRGGEVLRRAAHPHPHGQGQ